MSLTIEDLRRDEPLRKELSGINANPHFQKVLLAFQLHFRPGSLPLQGGARGMTAAELICYHQGFMEGAQKALSMIETVHLMAPRINHQLPEDSKKDPVPYWGMTQPLS